MAFTRTVDIKLGSSMIGLALQAQLRVNSVDTGAPITTGFDELGAGNYTWKYAAFATGVTHTVKFAKQSDPTVVLATTVVEDPGAAVAAISGAGAVLWTDTLINPSDDSPLDGVEAWVTTTNDPAARPVASQVSDTFGRVKFMLDPGSYWLWLQLRGFNTSAPRQITVA